MKVNENLNSFLLRAPKKYRPNCPVNLFQLFLDGYEEVCNRVHDEKFEANEISTPRAIEISRPSVSKSC